MTNENKIPIWFWIIAVIALLWNLMGVGAFYSDMTISAERLAAMTSEQRGLYEAQPIWAKIAFGGAVILGVIGSIGLLLRAPWAKTVLTLSLAFVLGQMAHSFMIDAYSIMGSGSLIMGIVVLVFALFLVWFAGFARAKGIMR